MPSPRRGRVSAKPSLFAGTSGPNNRRAQTSPRSSPPATPLPLSTSPTSIAGPKTSPRPLRPTPPPPPPLLASTSSPLPLPRASAPPSSPPSPLPAPTSATSSPASSIPATSSFLSPSSLPSPRPTKKFGPGLGLGFLSSLPGSPRRSLSPYLLLFLGGGASAISGARSDGIWSGDVPIRGGGGREVPSGSDSRQIAQGISGGPFLAAWPTLCP